VSGVKDTIKQVATIYSLYDADENLQANYPAAAHSFPADARNIAYQFLEKHLGLEKP